jgi:drug/metabolite transporter (DMT)-like permease
MNSTSEKSGYVAAALTLVVWSSSYAGIAYGLQVFTPGELVLLRFGLASLCLAALALCGAFKLPPLRDWPAVIVLGLIGNTAYQLCLCYAMTRLSAGAAAVVISMIPGVTSVLAVLRLHERLSRRAVIGLAAAFAGTLLVTLGQGKELRFEPMALLAFGAVVCSSVYFVWQKPLFARTSPLGVSAATIFTGTLGFIPFGLDLPAKLATAGHAEIAAVVYLALVPTVIGYLSWSFALSRAPASRVSSFLYLQPLIACLVAWFWLKEIPTWLTVGGGTLAIAGVVLTTSRLEFSWLRRKAPVACASPEG